MQRARDVTLIEAEALLASLFCLQPQPRLAATVFGDSDSRPRSRDGFCLEWTLARRASLQSSHSRFSPAESSPAVAARPMAE